MRIKMVPLTYYKCIDRCSYSSTGSIKNSVTKSQLAQFVCKHPVSYVVIGVYNIYALMTNNKVKHYCIWLHV